MSCPDRYALFVGLEEGSPGLTEHLATCEKCQAIVENELTLSQSLCRLRDPSPPAELSANVLSRIEGLPADEARKNRLGTLFNVLFLTISSIGLALCLSNVDYIVEAALRVAETLHSVGIALGALGRAVGIDYTEHAFPLYVGNALAVITVLVILYRLLNPSARTRPRSWA